MLNIRKACDDCRYSSNLESVINGLDGKEILRIAFKSDYQGYVDIDVLLSDGKVYSYNYFYGSCSGCDEWEDRNLSNDEIEQIMLNEATIFDDINQYNEWRKNIKE